MEIKVVADFLESQAGEILLAFKALDDEPQAQVKISLSEDRQTATLKRNETQKVLIENVHPDIREKLAKANKILVTETGAEGIIHGYQADVES